MLWYQYCLMPKCTKKTRWYIHVGKWSSNTYNDMHDVHYCPFDAVSFDVKEWSIDWAWTSSCRSIKLYSYKPWKFFWISKAFISESGFISVDTKTDKDSKIMTFGRYQLLHLMFQLTFVQLFSFAHKKKLDGLWGCVGLLIKMAYRVMK